MEHVIVFDMDNTLYDCRKARAEFDEHLQKLLETRLGLQPKEVPHYITNLQRRLGTSSTIIGLHIAHGWSTKELITETFERINAACINAEPSPRQHVLRSNTHRVLFTNTPSIFAQRVLAQLDLVDCFQHIVAFEEFFPHQKPHEESFACVTRLFPKNTPLKLVDDAPDNITKAHELGWSTVWFAPPWKTTPDKTPPADRIITSLAEL